MLVVKVHACASLQDLEPLRSEWDDLLLRSDNASVFTSWEWTEATWRFAAPGKRPLVLLAREEGQLIGVLPLERVSRFKVFHTVNVIGCAPGGYPYGDYGGLVAARGRERAVWLAMLGYMRDKRWSMLDLRNCRVGGSGREEAMYKMLPSGARWGVRVQQADMCRRLSLRGSFEDYLASLSSNGRQNIRRKLRKLETGGHRIETVDVSDERARNEALEAAFDYHQARWADDPSGGAFPDANTRAMHRHLAARMAQSGRLDLKIIRSGEGNIAGVIYNFICNGTGYFYQLGFSQSSEWAPYSLGVCLLAESIKSAAEAGCHTFDLLRGDHDYKRHFGGDVTGNLRVTIYKYDWLPAAEEAARKVKRMLGRSRQASVHHEQAAAQL